MKDVNLYKSLQTVLSQTLTPNVQSFLLVAWSLGSTIVAISLHRELSAVKYSLSACHNKCSELDFGYSATDTEGKECNNWLAEEGDPFTDPWRFLKWIPKPAKCRVRNMWLEELEPGLNFRRGGGQLNFWDPALLPFLRGFQDFSLAKRKRRVLLDLGANVFTTSTSWFCHVYPLDFTEIHSFEVNNNTFVIPPLMSKADDKKAAQQQQFQKIPNWQLSRIKAHNVFVGVRDGENQVNITRFIKDELKLKPNDAVVVKMDIEGAEWEILSAWLNDPEMAAIVDELFVEIHYNHPSFLTWGWKLPNFGHSREEAIELMQKLRSKGFFAHFWP